MRPATDGKALLASIAAFTSWGLFPIYWKFFPELPGTALFMHRLFWSLVTLSILVPATGRLPSLRAIVRDKRRWWLFLSAVLISSNWLLYVTAVTHGKIIEASMGYFLNPLLNVLFGAFFLRERLRRWQWPAVLLAMAGVGWIAWFTGSQGFPWMAIALSLTFAFYGVIRKLTHVGSLEGLCYETWVVFPFFALWWFIAGGNPLEDFRMLGLGKSLLLCFSGFITCFPLVLFAYATRRLSLQAIGFTQYLSPTFKFLCGWWVFHETLSPERLQGFVLIWAGLAWYTMEGFWEGRNQKTGRGLVPSPSAE